jgi:hypothetical protein
MTYMRRFVVGLALLLAVSAGIGGITSQSRAAGSPDWPSLVVPVLWPGTDQGHGPFVRVELYRSNGRLFRAKDNYSNPYEQFYFRRLPYDTYTVVVTCQTHGVVLRKRIRVNREYPYSWQVRP